MDYENIDHIVSDYLLNNAIDLGDLERALTCYPRLLHSRTADFDESLLDIAVNRGDLYLVRLLLRLGADSASVPIPHELPLIAAVRSKKPLSREIARVLLHHGADVDAPGNYNGSALHAAVGESSVEFAELLIQHAANVNVRPPPDGCTPLYAAVLTNNVAMIKLLLNSGASPLLANNSTGALPLEVAISNNNPEILRMLIEAGASPNQSGLGREPPLVQAALGNAVHAAKTLIDNGAQLDCMGDSGIAPLHAAVEVSSKELATLLLAKGANPNIRHNASGTTPLMIAVENNDLEMVAILLKHGAWPNITDERGVTPLLLATKRVKGKDDARCAIERLLRSSKKRESG